MCDRATQLGCSVGWTAGSGHSQEYSLNFTLQGGKIMEHINSSPSNTLITFLNTHLVRKDVGWLHYQLSHQHQFSNSHSSSPSVLLPLPFFSMTLWVPRASPSSSSTSLLCTQKIQQSRGCPHIPQLFGLSLPHPLYRHLLSPSVAAFWARRGCADLCLLSTKCCRDWSTTGAPQPDGAQ